MTASIRSVLARRGGEVATESRWAVNWWEGESFAKNNGGKGEISVLGVFFYPLSHSLSLIDHILKEILSGRRQEHWQCPILNEISRSLPPILEEEVKRERERECVCVCVCI